MNDGFIFLFIYLDVISFLSFAFILIKITYNRKFFKGYLFNMYAIMVSIHLIQNCSVNLFISPQIKFQVLFFVLTDTSILVWNSILVYNAYHFICFHTKILKKNWVWSIITGFGIPSIITIIGYFVNFSEINYDNFSFWISIAEKNIFALVFGWILLIFQSIFFFLNLFFYFKAKRAFYQNFLEQEQRLKLSRYYKIFNFALVESLTILLTIINRYLIMLEISSPTFSFITFMFNNSSGIIYFIVFYNSFGVIYYRESSDLLSVL